MVSSLRYCQMCGAANQLDDEICFACTRPLKQDECENTPAGLLHERYQILNQVGTGGFGAVYKALDTLSQERVVAIKQINLRGLTPQENIEATDAFNREVSLLSNLSHSHLPRIHDRFTDPDHWYLVMDFIEGQTLEQYLRDNVAGQALLRSIPLDEILESALQLCDVLDYLHTRQPAIIFRDLKPSNIMRTPQGQLYLIDFGIARHFKPGKLKDTMPFGSPGYAAPEQYGKAQTTPRADIYSLGALLHHLLSGIDPAETPFSFAPLRLYGLAGLTELDVLIARMVAMNSDKRPPNMREVTAELLRIKELRDLAEPRIWRPPVGQTPPAALSSYSSWKEAAFAGSGQLQVQQQVLRPATGKPSRRLFVGLGLSLVAVLGIEALGAAPSLFRLAHRGYSYTHDQPPVVLNQSPMLKLAWDNTTPVEGVAWSKDGKLLASVSEGGKIGVWDWETWGAEATGSIASVYTAAAGGSCSALSWSSNGNYFAAGVDNMVQVWSTAAWQQVPTYNSDDGVSELAWSPRGSFLAVSNSSNAVSILQVQGREVNLVNKPLKPGPYRYTGRLMAGHLAWSPNGQHLAVSVGSIVEVIASNALMTRHFLVPRYDERQGWITALTWSNNGRLIAASHSNGRISLWDAADGDLINSYTVGGDGLEIRDLLWSPDSRMLGGVTSRGFFTWPIDHLERLPTFYHSDGAAMLERSLGWSPDGSLLATGGDDGAVRIWRLNAD